MYLHRTKILKERTLLLNQLIYFVMKEDNILKYMNMHIVYSELQFIAHLH